MTKDVALMDQPRYGMLMRYDTDAGTLTLGPWPPSAQPPVVFHDAAMLANALPTDMQAATIAATYGLALVAHAWADRPSDSRRGALIQATEQVSMSHPQSALLRFALEHALTNADAAVMRGDSAEVALIRHAEATTRNADRAAERCGRRAAALLDAEDTLLAFGTSATLLWMLRAAADEGRAIALHAHTAVLEWASATGVGQQASTAPTLAVVCADAVGPDGAAATPDAATAAAARAEGLPLYVVCASAPLAALPARNLLSADSISAIVTDRAIYRPAMIGRYHTDGDAPLDVIPLN